MSGKTRQRDDKRARRLPPDTLHKLLSLPDGSLKGMRDRAMMALMANGLRVGEIQRLNVDDVDLDAGVIRVLGRSGPSVLGLTEQACTALRAWMGARRLMGMEDRAVFVALRQTYGRKRPGRRPNERTIRQIVDSYLARLGNKCAQLSCDALRLSSRPAT
ncbi:MAG: tyrosine-type recombinase/integrase [Thermoflexales bacterium]|nr:tyrosine-type recombinase/integrase [Thermoflexales bacterium]